MTRKWRRSVIVALLLTAFISGCNKTLEMDDNESEASDKEVDTLGKGGVISEYSYSNTGGIKLPIVDEPTELTWMVTSDLHDLNNKLVIKEIEKRTGISLNIQAYSPYTFNEKLNGILASGKLPDIWYGLPLSRVNDLGHEGIVASVSDYIDQLPNFQKLYVEENQWVMDAYTDDNNKLYTWPIYGVNREVNHGFLYRKDIFEQLGIELWNNTEEFYQVLKDLKTAYPDSYPYASKMKEYIFRDWGYGWGITGTYYPAFYDEADRTWKFQFTDPRHKEMLDFMKKLYNEGLLDPEFLTDTESSWTAKMTVGNSAFVTFDWIGRLDMFYEQVMEEYPDYDLRYGNPVGPTNNIQSTSKIMNWSHTVTNNENAETALKLLDYLTSPSGAELITLGIRGKTYIEDSSGNITYNEFSENEEVSIKKLEDKYGLWIEGMYLRADERSIYFDYSEKEQEAQDMMKESREPLDPILKFTDEENIIIANLQQNLLEAATEFSAKYILIPSYGESEWIEWKGNAKSLGEKEYIQAYNHAQERLNEQ